MTMAKTAGILVVGNEILSGKVVDTNSPYLCQELYTLGVDVRRVAVVPDDIAIIAGDVATFAQMFDYVFTTGGVGPTHDDVTIEAVAKGLQRQVVIHPDETCYLKVKPDDSITLTMQAKVPGNVSVRTAAGSSDGPAFATTISYDTAGVPPGVADVTPSLLVTDRSAVGTNTVSVSVAESFPVSGSVTEPDTVALFDNVPVADGSIVQSTV